MTEQPIPEIQLVVEKAAGCPAQHLRSVLVVEGWKEQVVWEGPVEVFTLKGHPKAKLAYGWRNFEGDFTAVLEIPPVDSAATAVKVAIAAKARGIVRLRRLHWADTAGIVIACLLIVGGLISLVGPQQSMVLFHSAGDMTGASIDGVREIATPATVRFYGITALSLGVGLALFMRWALKTTDDESSPN